GAWRRGRDSNPGQRFCPCNRLAGGCLRPARPPLQTVSVMSITDLEPAQTQEPGAAMTALRQFLRDVWTLAIPYWSSEDRWPARGLLAVLVAMNLGLVYLNVVFNRWNNAFYNTLQDKDYAAFTHQLGVFTGLAAMFIIVAVYQLYLN